MLHLYLGTDREKARAQMQAAIEKRAKGASVVRITDAHTTHDLNSALQGGGMFGGKRVLVFENVCTNPDLCDVFLNSLAFLAKSEEDVFIFESKPLAELRKKLEKHAETVEKFDAVSKERDTSIFQMANALRARDKKALWVAYMREVAKGNAPEAVHGVLFWAAKDMFLKSGKDPMREPHAASHGAHAAPRERAAKLIAELAALPHEARRRGELLEYALERFVLSGA